MSLKDKIVVVTGGSRGLGLGLVEALVDQGARVSVVARSARGPRGGQRPPRRQDDLGGHYRREGREADPCRDSPGRSDFERRRDAGNGADR